MCVYERGELFVNVARCWRCSNNELQRGLKEFHRTQEQRERRRFAYPQSVREINKLPACSFKKQKKPNSCQKVTQGHLTLAQLHTGRHTHIIPPGNQIPAERILFIVFFSLLFLSLFFLWPSFLLKLLLSFLCFHLRNKSSK